MSAGIGFTDYGQQLLNDAYREYVEGLERKAAELEAELATMAERAVWHSNKRMKAEAELAALKARSCVTCGRACDTVDESDYEGEDDFYCAYWAEREKP